MIKAAPKPNQWELGQQGEQIVLEHYLNLGYELVTKNFQYYKQGTQGRQGEIDLIMKRENKLYLIEVKTRSNGRYGTTIGQISVTKLKTLYKTFLKFLQVNPQFRSYYCQMDAAEVFQNQVKVWPNCYSFDFVVKK